MAKGRTVLVMKDTDQGVNNMLTAVVEAAHRCIGR